MTRNTRILLVCAIAVIGIGAAGFTAVTLIPASAPKITTSLSGAIGGPFTLVAADSSTVTDQTYRGKWLLIYFGYTFCPDACPTALNNIGVALQELGAEASNIQPLFITVDPKRDTPQVMADYLKSFDSRIVGLTGTQAQTDSAARAYRVYVAPERRDGDDYLVDHSAYLYIMSPQGRFVNVIAGDVPGDQMANKLRKMIAHLGS